jgi:hypothetical protein
MATIEEVLARLQALEQEATHARQELMAARQEAASANAAAKAAERRAQTSDQVIASLAQLPQAVAQAVSEARTSGGSSRQLTDPRGLGKPPSYSGGEAEFGVWSRKTENYITSVYPEGHELLRAAAESMTEVDTMDLKGKPGMPKNEVIDEIDIQVYSAARLWR